MKNQSFINTSWIERLRSNRKTVPLTSAEIAVNRLYADLAKNR
ncbi:hypothetical protein WDW89_21555 [Deltaproteobacteria bacterium TL4]